MSLTTWRSPKIVFNRFANEMPNLRDFTRTLSPRRGRLTRQQGLRLLQMEEVPDALETGTPNLPGIAGLAAALRELDATALARRAAELQTRRSRLYAGLHSLG